MEVKTVRIKVEPSEGNPEGVVAINESDFDPAQHTLVDAEAAPPVAWGAKTKDELRDHLDSKGVEYTGSMGKAELVALCEANP